MNFSIMNCRSLKFKLDSLSGSFTMNKSHFILTNETWFKPRDPQLKTYLSDLEDKYEIECIRKDRKLRPTGLGHGGVLIFFDKATCNMKKFPLNALKRPEKRDFEILACRGRLKGVKREVVLFSVYLPPGIQGKKLTEILETLTDAISESIAKADNPWLVIGGDFNRYDTSYVTQMIPELIKARPGPTRGDATLDYAFINFDTMIEKTKECYPVESYMNKSDHKSVSYESILTRPSSSAWETSEYLKVTSEGSKQFKNLIEAESWLDIQSLHPDVDAMT